jgi:hypothetical protein
MQSNAIFHKNCLLPSSTDNKSTTKTDAAPATAPTPTTIELPTEQMVAPSLSASINALHQQFDTGNSSMQQFFAQLPPPKPLISSQKPIAEQTYSSQSLLNQLNLQLTTKDGDKISVNLLAGSNRAQFHSQDASGIKNANISEQFNQFNFSVEGDLSDQELNDINDFMQQLTQAVGSFFSGDLSSAVKTLSNMNMDGQHISAVDFSLQSQAIATYKTTQTFQQKPAIPAQVPAWQKMDDYFNDVLTQQQLLPKHLQSQFLEQLLPTLDWYQSQVHANEPWLDTKSQFASPPPESHNQQTAV